MKTRSLISFDWAMKRLLRQKANFEVLEGFLSELLLRKIVIKNIGESEGNPTDKDDKTNKVDILVEADDTELIIIELQYDTVNEYFHRMLYGVCKAITDYMSRGNDYAKVRKVYSVNIVYFDLGAGDDYIYHGVTNFTGVHTRSELKLTAAQQRLYEKTVAGDIYPEYYIIRITGFNDKAKNTLDQWIYYLKNNRIEDDFTAKGLDKVKEILQFDNLNDDEKAQYLRDIDHRLLRDSEIRSALLEGEMKGEAKGEAKGRAEMQENTIIAGRRAGVPVETMSMMTGLTGEEIAEILKKHGLA
jgi:predicted transposase/invertase (TIGR01784 family)